MASEFTPFTGRPAAPATPTRLLRRFARSGHVAEIRERTVTAFNGLEFIVFVDGSLLESQMFHGPRLEDYASAMASRAKQLAEDGWIEEPSQASLL